MSCGSAHGRALTESHLDVVPACARPVQAVSDLEIPGIEGPGADDRATLAAIGVGEVAADRSSSQEDAEQHESDRQSASDPRRDGWLCTGCRFRRRRRRLWVRALFVGRPSGLPARGFRPRRCGRRQSLDGEHRPAVETRPVEAGVRDAVSTLGVGATRLGRCRDGHRVRPAGNTRRPELPLRARTGNVRPSTRRDGGTRRFPIPWLA